MSDSPRRPSWPARSSTHAKPTTADKPDEDKADEELEPLEGGAETMADLDEEAGQANRPGTERPPV